MWFTWRRWIFCVHFPQSLRTILHQRTTCASLVLRLISMQIRFRLFSILHVQLPFRSENWKCKLKLRRKKKCQEFLKRRRINAFNSLAEGAFEIWFVFQRLFLQKLQSDYPPCLTAFALLFAVIVRRIKKNTKWFMPCLSRFFLVSGFMLQKIVGYVFRISLINAQTGKTEIVTGGLVV